MLLNPKQLEAFRLVMLRGSVTMAARDLHVSQPAISRLIKEFELRSGLTLFERHGNQLVPTPEATLLLAEVERYASGLQALSTFAAELGLRRRGMLRIVSLPAMAMGYLPRFVARFITDRSLASVYLHGMPSHLVVEAITAGQAEIGFAAAPPERPGLRIEPIKSRAVLVVPQSHRLAARGSANEQDLTGERFISLEGPSFFAAHTGTMMAERGVEVVVKTPLSGIACSLVAEGAGIALVDPFSASDYEGRGLVVLKFEPAVEVPVSIVTSAQRRLSQISTEFIDAFRLHVLATGA